MLRHGGSDWFDLISDFLVCEGVTNRIKGIYWAQRASSANGVAAICILGVACAVETEKPTHSNACDTLAQTAVRKARDFGGPWNGQGVVAMW